MLENNEFNIRQFNKIEALIKENKKEYLVDLHIHTCYSADGLTTVKQAISRAKNKGFDIISITDHDSISAYKELLNSETFDIPESLIIIPGIEFSVSYPAYEGRCHVLKYFYNTNDIDFLNNLEQNKKAYWKRINLQFKRIYENKCLQYFFDKNNINCSIKDYRVFLEKSVIQIPEYDTLIDYIFSLLSQKGILVWDVFSKAVEINEIDTCEKRRELKKASLDRFYEKNANKDISTRGRKIRPILAPVGIDDADFPGYISSGSLSVNEYGQVPIEKLLNSGFNILAHPSGTKLNLINDLANILSGLELNIRSDTWLNDIVNEKANNLKMLVTKGSDTHSYIDTLYDNINFYKMTHEELVCLANCARQVVFK